MNDKYANILSFQTAKETAEPISNPLRGKKLYVLAALLVSRCLVSIDSVSGHGCQNLCIKCHFFIYLDYALCFFIFLFKPDVLFLIRLKSTTNM